MSHPFQWLQIPQEWRDVLAKVQTKFPEAVIAGGALRDLVTRRRVKDIDIFVTARGEDTGAILAELLGEDMLPICEAQMEYEEHFSEIHEAYQPVHLGNRRSPDDEDFFLADFGPPYQIIALNMDVTARSAVERFDFGICRIAFDGKELFVHPDFLHDHLHSVFTVRNTRNLLRSRARHERISDRYQNWPIIVPGEDDRD